MKWSHLFAASVSLLGMQIAVAQPAHASVAVLMSISLSPIDFPAPDWYAASLAQTACDEESAIARQSVAVGIGFQSKASSILGGIPSKLEMIAAQQASGTPLSVGARIEPASGGIRCQRFALPWNRQAPVFGPVQRSTDPDQFLASARLPLHKTSFDREWDKVRRSGLSMRALSGLATSHGKPTKATLNAVNAWSNARITYVEDRVLYGVPDYWATASATLRRRAGDCEDIAIVKMQALAALGVPRSDMYLTIARDTVRNADHALLVVKLDDQYWLLDNATDTVLDGSMNYDYRPIMSFSTSGKWLHGYQRIQQPAIVTTAANVTPASVKFAVR